MITPEKHNKRSWLAIHNDREHVSASQVGTILGVNPYASPEVLWYLRTGRTAPFEGNTATLVGHTLEKTIADLYRKETKHDIYNPGGKYGIVRHPDHPWLFCTLDRVLEYRGCVSRNGLTVDSWHYFGPLELKWSLSRDSWGDDEIPLSYELQLQVQMACIGARRGVIAALVGHADLKIYEREYNEELMEIVIPKLAEFRRLVMEDEHPGFDFSHTATQELIKKLHPNDNGESVHLAEDFDEMIETKWDLNAEKKETQAKIDEVDTMVRSAIGDNTFGVTPMGRKISNKTQGQEGKSFRKLNYPRAPKEGK